MSPDASDSEADEAAALRPRDATESTPLLTGSQPLVSSIGGGDGDDGDNDNDNDDDDHWGSELRLLVKYSLPLVATYLLQYSHSVITTFVAGHLSSDDLAAASIGMTTMNIVGYAAVEGMATALDTLCAQAYGSGNLAGVGLHVQRMLLFAALAILPIGAFWVFSPAILGLFVRQPHLAAAAGSFLRVSLVGLPGYAAFEVGKRFLQAQGNFGAAMVAILLCAPANAVLSWYFAFPLGMGLDGAALGAALANDLRPLLLLAYVLAPCGRWSRRCWGSGRGFSRDALTGWGPMVGLSVAGTLVNLGEWAAFEIVTFSTSYLGTEYLAAQSILTTISVVAWHVPFSVSVAVSTRVGHLIGAGRLARARRAAALYAVVFVAIGAADGAAMFALRDRLPALFSDDARVRRLAAGSMLAVAAFQVIDAVICCTNGLLRGLGRQSVAAWVVFAVNYLGAVPLAVWLELGSPTWRLDGAWAGLGAGMVLIAVVEALYMKALRWQDCVASAKIREGM
ncbi:MATE efflux family protein [Durotheca rogersii]|uniref:MATE efflux family protein n=1 Tax=Durotheca rogersii TaxID=419775 RepID=UPI00221FD0D1|nr:MATE efflux family protein [Durotheca rogersii]KAI5864920.1 MATE efflux family protein [Durotheca rogersii]